MVRAEASGEGPAGQRIGVTCRAGVGKPRHGGLPRQVVVSHASKGEGRFWRTESRTRSSCQVDGLGGRNGAGRAVRRHSQEPRLGGRRALHSDGSSVVEKTSWERCG